MSIQRIQPSKRFSEVVIHNNTAYFAGQVPEKTVKQNAYEQTKEVLSLIDKLLAEIGSEKVKFLPRKSSLLIWQIMLNSTKHGMNGSIAKIHQAEQR